MDGRVAARAGADRPGAADVARLRGRRVVAALAVGLADRVDGGQVEHVEAHAGAPLDLAVHVAERAVAAAAERAREQLVPGREPGQRAIHPDGHGKVGVGGVRARVVGRHQLRQGGVERRRGGGLGVVRREAVAPLPKPRRRGRRGACRRGVDQLRAGGELDPHVLAGLDPAGELVAPGGEAIDPAPHRVGVAAEHVDGERRREAVVSDRLHAHLVEAALALAAVADDRGDDVVAVGEDVGGDVDAVAGDPLHAEAAGVDARAQVLDHDPPPPVDVRNGAALELAGCPGHGGWDARRSRPLRRRRGMVARGSLTAEPRAFSPSGEPRSGPRLCRGAPGGARRCGTAEAVSSSRGRIGLPPGKPFVNVR